MWPLLTKYWKKCFFNLPSLVFLPSSVKWFIHHDFLFHSNSSMQVMFPPSDVLCARVSVGQTRHVMTRSLMILLSQTLRILASQTWRAGKVLNPEERRYTDFFDEFTGAVFILRLHVWKSPGLTVIIRITLWRGNFFLHKIPESGENVTVRTCAVDGGTLTADTEIVRLSHCGAFYLEDR